MKGVLYWSKGKPCFQAILAWLLLQAGAVRLPAQNNPPSDVAGALWPGIEKRLDQDGGDTARYFILRQVRSRCGGDYDCLYGSYYDLMIRLERRFNLPAAIYVGEELARVAARQGGPEAEARACKNLSRFYGALGNERLAIVNLERALRLFEQAGGHSEIIRTKMSLLEHSLSYRKAEGVLPEMEALLAQAIQNKDTSSISYLHLRLILRYQGAGLYDKMAEHVTAIEKIPLSGPIRPGEYGIAIHAALGRADLFMVEKKYGEAERYYQKALRLCRAEPSRWLEIHVLQSLAKLEWGRNNSALAKSYLDTAQVKAENLELDELLARNFELKARAADAEGRYAQALEYTRKKYFHEEKFRQRSAGFDLQKYYLQLEKEQLAAEKKNQELELNLKKTELRASRIIMALAFLLAAGLLIGLYQRWKGMRALARQNALIRQQTAELKSLDAAKSRFFANVSHELRTPLTLMLGPIQSLLKEDKLSERQSRLLGMASQSGQQLQQLVDEILDLRKLEMGKMAPDEKPTALAAFFRNYFAQFESLADRKQIDYSYDIRVGEEVVANIDPEKNRQILYNLLSNAFKFTPAGGRVEANLSLQAGSLRLTVADSGPGIHPDDLPHVFDRFFQSARPGKPAEGGTGIGLALCREYAQLFGGTIEVDSILGQGAVFRLVYPVSSVSSEQPADEKAHRSFSSRRDPADRDREGSFQSAVNSEQPAVDSGRPLKVSGERKPTILVVEDNPWLQDYIRLILSEKYEAATAENGQAALDYLLHPANCELRTANCQLILSDLMMPVMDGYQLLERLKSDDATRHIPVIMLTGPRQTGKTTLLKSIFGEMKDVLWLNGDDAETRILLEEVTTTKWKRIIGKAKIAVVDEAQRIRDIGIKLKLITDQLPDVQLVASGSSAFELANQINEPLTGRKWQYHLFPVSYGEMEAHHGFLNENRGLPDRLVYGYYPEVVSHPGEERDILNQLADSFLYKDILMWERIKKPEKLTKLLQALAFQLGSEVSYHELGQITGLDNQTVENYITLLEQTFIVFRLPPLSRNLRKELKTKRKIYFYDNGIRNALIAQYQPLELRQDKGALWENWLISERKKWLHYHNVYANTFFWRTQDRQEIDYVEEREGFMCAYEMKWSPKAKAAFSKTFTNAYPQYHTRVVHRDNFFEFLT